MEESKSCSQCKVIKPLQQFTKAKTTRSGVGPRCFICENKRQQIWRDKNPGKHNQAVKRFRDKNPEKVHEFSLLSNYNMTFKQKMDLFKQQLGKCAMPDCGLDLISVYKANVDHNHETKKIRSLLCGPCNRLLGYFETYENRFTAFRKYLKDNG